MHLRQQRWHLKCKNYRRQNRKTRLQMDRIPSLKEIMHRKRQTVQAMSQRIQEKYNGNVRTTNDLKHLSVLALETIQEQEENEFVIKLN